MKRDGKTTVLAGYFQLGSGEGIGNGGMERRCIADFEDGLQGGGEIAAVRRQNRRLGGDLQLPGWCVDIGSEVIVKAPGADLIA
jgi:hypothetical protein